VAVTTVSFSWGWACAEKAQTSARVNAAGRTGAQWRAKKTRVFIEMEESTK
jgi:hypothetical protein